MKERIEEVKCRCCDTLLARGSRVEGSYSLAFNNFKVRDKNAKVAKIDFEYKKDIPGQYDDQVVSVHSEISIDIVCRKCGHGNKGVIRAYMGDQFY